MDVTLYVLVKQPLHDEIDIKVSHLVDISSSYISSYLLTPQDSYDRHSLVGDHYTRVYGIDSPLHMWHNNGTASPNFPSCHQL